MNTDFQNLYSSVSASKLLERLNLTEPPFDPFEVARLLGVPVDTSISFDKVSISGEISLDANRNPIIWINPLDPPNKKRFTMAHEIGHLVNDILPKISEIGVNDSFSDPEMNLRRDGRQDPKEYAANEFAGELLMPREHIVNHGNRIISEYQNYNGPAAKISADTFTSSLAHLFSVSEAAMNVRLRRLGIIH